MKNGHVVSTTQSVAMTNNINYGTALLKTTVSYGTTSLSDNNHAIQLYKDPSISDSDEPDNIVTVGNSSFKLVGILIGGQSKKVGWNYLPKASTTESPNPQGYVYDCMIKNNYIVGGEQSGHIIFSKLETTGDGIVTALQIMEVVIESKKSLGALAGEVRIFPQLLKNVHVTDKKAAMENEAVQSAIEKAKAELGSDGRILVRASGTEPLIRVMAEAESDEICAKYVYDIIAVMRQQNLITG